jgi:predicted DNA-binding protein
MTPVRLPPELLARAKRLAEADRRPLSAYLRLLIERGIDEAEQLRGGV